MAETYNFMECSVVRTGGAYVWKVEFVPHKESKLGINCFMTISEAVTLQKN